MPGTPIPTLFYGGLAVARVLQANDDFTDDGVAYTPLLITNAVAPAGAAGECVFLSVYPTITSTMLVDLRFTPIVDHVAMDGTGGQPDERVTISLPDLTATGRLTQRYEIGLALPFPLTGPARYRTAMRGAWFQVQLDTSSALAAGDLILEQVELEYEVVRESLQATNIS